MEKEYNHIFGNYHKILKIAMAFFILLLFRHKLHEEENFTVTGAQNDRSIQTTC